MIHKAAILQPSTSPFYPQWCACPVSSRRDLNVTFLYLAMRLQHIEVTHASHPMVIPIHPPLQGERRKGETVNMLLPADGQEWQKICKDKPGHSTATRNKAASVFACRLWPRDGTRGPASHGWPPQETESSEAFLLESVPFQPSSDCQLSNSCSVGRGGGWLAQGTAAPHGPWVPPPHLSCRSLTTHCFSIRHTSACGYITMTTSHFKLQRPEWEIDTPLLWTLV